MAHALPGAPSSGRRERQKAETRGRLLGEGEERLAFVGEVHVEGARGEIRRAGDVLGPGGVEAPLGEEPAASGGTVAERGAGKEPLSADFCLVGGDIAYTMLGPRESVGSP